jgi:enoyl-CoA hydratase/carnithine racemase
MDASNYETILTSLDDGVLTITMNRPDRLNAWTYKMGVELQEVLEAGNSSAEVNVFILRHSRHF